MGHGLPCPRIRLLPSVGRLLHLSASFQQRNASTLPGPPTQPIIGNLRNVNIGDIFGALPEDGRLRLYEQFGPIFRLKILGNTLVYIRDLDAARELLRTPNITNSNTFRQAFGFFFPNSMIVLEGEPWQRVRKVGQKAFQRHHLDGMVAHVASMCDRAIEKHMLVEGSSVDMHRIMAELTFDAFHRFAYAVDFNVLGGDHRDLLDACITISESMNARTRAPIPLLWKLPTSKNRQINAAKDTLMTYISKLYDDRMEAIDAGRGGEALLDAFIAANVEEHVSVRLSKDEILDQIGTFFFGAFDTTSNTLALTLHHLAHNAEIQDELANSLQNIDFRSCTAASLQDLSLLSNVTDETNRFTPTAQAFPRTVLEETVVGGFTVPAGATCLIDWCAANRDPQNWPGQTTEDLLRFRPSRWQESKPKKMAHLPFGHGPRICIGSQLALLEMRFIVGYLTQRLKFSPDPKRPTEYGTKLAFGPKDGAWLYVTPRSDQKP